jgi:hypothetical protein
MPGRPGKKMKRKDCAVNNSATAWRATMRGTALSFEGPAHGDPLTRKEVHSATKRASAVPSYDKDVQSTIRSLRCRQIVYEAE